MGVGILGNVSSPEIRVMGISEKIKLAKNQDKIRFIINIGIFRLNKNIGETQTCPHGILDLN